MFIMSGPLTLDDTNTSAQQTSTDFNTCVGLFSASLYEGIMMIKWIIIIRLDLKIDLRKSC